MKIDSIASLPRKNRISGLSEHAHLLCARAKELEEAGEFEAARATISEFWQRIGERPRVDGLGDVARAEVLLRAGALSGWLGSARQITGAQEIAKDLISEAARLFEECGLHERVVEARVDLAICYWREGAFAEARITLKDALLRLGDLDSEQRLRIFLNKALVETAAKQYRKALRLFRESAPLFEVSGNHALRGKFHNEYGIVLKNLGFSEYRDDYIDRALIEYSAASFHFEQAGHNRFQGRVENNEGFLFTRLGRFTEAHDHLDRARSIFARFKDKGSVAEVDDSRARAFLAQGLLDKAEKAATSAVRSLREGDERSQLAAALTTNAIALARTGRHASAVAMLNEAASVAAQGGDPETGGIASITIIEELSAVLSPAELLTHYQNAESALKHSEHTAIRLRLGESARTLLAKEALTPSTLPLDAPAAAEISHDTSLEQQVLSYEAELIRHALQKSDGSVTRAARLLGVTHQGLAFILNGRQKNLLSSRKPAKPRRRSIIRYH